MTKEESIYEEIKVRYIQHYGKRGWFYKAYFENEEDGKAYFIDSLADNEPWLSNDTRPVNDAIEIVWENVTDGIFNSSLIARQVDSVTDKYIGDCSF